jgi:hypothetical protein
MHNKEVMKFIGSAQQGCNIVHSKKVMHNKEVRKFIKSAQQAPRRHHNQCKPLVPFLFAAARLFGPSYVLLQVLLVQIS